ncbi:LPS-assembly protein LptD [Methylibium sp.]|uniref:LPS-assembly protein LptD n=1 Tax=Methylibium sp. TaxID=2067992 RepID=UPI003D131E3E
MKPVAAAVFAVTTGTAVLTGVARAQSGIEGPGLRPTAETGARFGPVIKADSGEGPLVIEADRLSGRPDLETVAEGAVEFRRGSLTLKADRVEYQQQTDLARASGNVEISRNGDVYRGPELQLKVGRFEGYFLSPSYHFGRTNAGGQADRFDFLDENRGVAYGATYTSCPAPDPAWLLSTDRLLLDTAAEEGTAEGAVLHFYGVPILAAPTLSFPLTDKRKSGWLPPIIKLDNKSGFEVGAPYYWDIAPNRDATLTPALLTRRGAALGTEFRYLEPGYLGTVQAYMLPDDQVANRSRWSLNVGHEARWEGAAVGEVDYGLALQRASDNDFWKDFAGTLPSPTPRLLPTDAYARRRFDYGWGDTVAYARVQTWQVLQDIDPASRIVSPYQREPQIGVRQRGAAAGLEWQWETEANRFSNDDASLQTGSRLHALGSLARPWSPIGAPGWTLTPRVSFNAASYDLDQPLADGRRHASRIIPTVSLDSAWIFERDSSAFGRDLTQTLEPRLLYVNTPFRDQTGLPNFDSAANDFNFTSIYSDNVFSGVDRVSDANQMTAGVTTRFLDRTTGAEALRLGIAQRMLLRTQRITADGEPITQRWSDLLLLGSSNLVPHWWLDGTLQYNADISRAVRSISSVRYSPSPLRTVSLTYRYTRNASEQVELGWQWPLNAPAREHAAAVQARDAQALDGLGAGSRPAPVAGCPGAWYTVGRVNYSRRDSRITDSIVGFEYDSGCWIGRIVAERLSTGLSQATTRLLFQLELIGLSRLGSNPLKVLRENVPGYRLLRDDSPVVAPALSTP